MGHAINKVIGMFRKLDLRNWILFEIWVLRFGILATFSDTQIVFL